MKTTTGILTLIGSISGLCIDKERGCLNYKRSGLCSHFYIREYSCRKTCETCSPLDTVCDINKAKCESVGSKGCLELTTRPFYECDCKAGFSGRYCKDEVTELTDWTNWNIPCQFLSQMRERTRRCVRGLNELDPEECGITVEQTIERFPCILVEKYNGTRVEETVAVSDSARAMGSPTTTPTTTLTSSPTTRLTTTSTTTSTIKILTTKSTTSTSTSTSTTRLTTTSTSTTHTTATDRTATKTSSGIGVGVSSTAKLHQIKKPFATYRITFPSDEEHNYSTTTLRPYPIEIIPKRNGASSNGDNDTPLTTTTGTTATSTTSTIKTTSTTTTKKPEKKHSPILETFIYEYEIEEPENDAEYRTYIYEYIPKPKPKPSFPWANLWLARWFRG